MGKLNIIPDFGAPLTVVAVDLVAEKFAPDWTKWIDGIMTFGGYLAAGFGVGGDGAMGAYLKNLGIASMPLTARNVYDWAMSQTGGTQKRLAFHPARTAARAAAPAPGISRSYQPEFKPAGAQAF